MQVKNVEMSPNRGFLLLLTNVALVFQYKQSGKLITPIHPHKWCVTAWTWSRAWNHRALKSSRSHSRDSEMK